MGPWQQYDMCPVSLLPTNVQCSYVIANVAQILNFIHLPHCSVLFCWCSLAGLLERGFLSQQPFQSCASKSEPKGSLVWKTELFCLDSILVGEAGGRGWLWRPNGSCKADIDYLAVVVMRRVNPFNRSLASLTYDHVYLPPHLHSTLCL